jgi:hypothetical protein
MDWSDQKRCGEVAEMLEPGLVVFTRFQNACFLRSALEDGLLVRLSGE